jgi:hypothetical protein
MITVVGLCGHCVHKLTPAMLWKQTAPTRALQKGKGPTVAVDVLPDATLRSVAATFTQESIAGARLAAVAQG